MLNRCFITVSGVARLKELKKAPDDGIACTLLMDGRRPEAARELLSFCYSSRVELPLTLAIVNSPEPEEAVASLAALFLASPFYLRNSEGVYLFVQDEESRKAWTQWMISQGYKNSLLQVCDLSSFSNDQFQIVRMSGGAVAEKSNDLETFYTQYLGSRYNSSDSFLIQGPDGTELSAVQELLHGTMERFAAGNPYLFHLMKEMAAMNRERHQLIKKAEGTAEELSILKELVRINKETNEVAYILEFYKKEYEILPLWYKRFGHLIKAVMGKRSWRSLIRDHEQGQN